MALKDDLEAFPKLWKEATPFWKGFLILSTATSIMSLSSIGQDIYAFRGFLYEGVLFYEKHLVVPLAVSLNISSYAINSIFFLLSVTGVYSRSIDHIKENIRKDDGPRVVVRILLAFPISILPYWAITTLHIDTVFFVMLTTYILVVVSIIFGTALPILQWSLLLLSVATLAGISDGLFRAL